MTDHQQLFKILLENALLYNFNNKSISDDEDDDNVSEKISECSKFIETHQVQLLENDKKLWESIKADLKGNL